MIKATDAIKIAKDHMEKAYKQFEEERKKKIIEEGRIRRRLWRTRGPVLIEQIEGYIRKAAAEGRHHIWEPSRNSPGGDSIVYLDVDDQPIKRLLTRYFTDNGFHVEDYAYGGMKITWFSHEVKRNEESCSQNL